MPSSIMKMSFHHFLQTLLEQHVVSLRDLPVKTQREITFKQKTKSLRLICGF